MAVDLLRLTSPDQVETLLEESESRPVLLFKHSVSCGTSAYALDELREVLDRPQADDVRYAVVVVQSDRETSNAVASRLGVRHETPQENVRGADRDINGLIMRQRIAIGFVHPDAPVVIIIYPRDLAAHPVTPGKRGEEVGGKVVVFRLIQFGGTARRGPRAMHSCSSTGSRC